VTVSLVLVSACGRIDFEARGSASDAAHDDGTAVGPVSWVKTFVETGGGNPTLPYTFTASATAGDAVVLQVFCASNNAPTGVTLAAPGWTFTQLGAIVGSTASGYWGTSFGAIAPDAAPATFTVTWPGATPCNFIDELGDEFAGAAPSGGAATFDAHAELISSGECTTTLTTRDANEAVWAACTINTVISVGAGYTKSADDSDGDWSEYRLTADPANTVEAVEFVTVNTTDDYVVTAVAIKPG